MKLKTTRYRLKLFLIAVAFIMHRSSSIAQKDFTKEPIRAAWLTNVGSDLLTSRDKIKEAVQYAKMCGLNTIITVTWNRGYTQYKSATMKKYFGIEVDPAYGGRDPLQELIEEAHKENIKVIAWFEFGFSNAYQDTGKYILDMHPEWASRDISVKFWKTMALHG